MEYKKYNWQCFTHLHPLFHSQLNVLGRCFYFFFTFVWGSPLPFLSLNSYIQIFLQQKHPSIIIVLEESLVLRLAQDNPLQEAFSAPFCPKAPVGTHHFIFWMATHLCFFLFLLPFFFCFHFTFFFPFTHSFLSCPLPAFLPFFVWILLFFSEFRQSS